MPNTLVGLFERDPARPERFLLLDQTEVQRDKTSPEFEHKFLIEHKQRRPGEEGTRSLLFRVYDVDSELVSEGAFRGASLVDWASVVAEVEQGGGEELRFPVNNNCEPLLDRQLHNEKCCLALRCRKLSDKLEKGARPSVVRRSSC
jgi:hypothetical protein